MRFAWDPGKSSRNLLARRFDFEFAVRIFDGPTLERDDDRVNYVERRVIAIGVANGLHLTVVYTDRAEPGGVVRRIISARRSSKNERQAYLQVVRQ
ncbi:MAG: BrnT family toxin [Candidatus Binatia bacterium]